jgi:lipoyl(octanoyl) transferase
VRRWVTLHGLALNVATRLDDFAALRPCGLDASVMTSLAAELGRTISLDEVRPLLIRNLGRNLGRDLRPASPAGWADTTEGS